MKKILKIFKNNQWKYLFVFIFLMIIFQSFSATSGAKYMANLITVLEDFFADGKKVLVAFTILVLVVLAIRSVASHNVMSFMENLFSNAWVIAIVGVATTILVAIGGATIEEKYTKNSNEIVVVQIINEE